MLAVTLLSLILGASLRWTRHETERLAREARSRRAATAYGNTGGARRIT